MSLALFGTAVACAEVTATHDAIITFDSRIFPRVLPRHHAAPVRIQIKGHIKARKNREPAALTKLELAIHQAANIFHRGLPVCDEARIDPASNAQALEECPGSQIGYGRIQAQSTLPGTKHFFFNGRAILLNGRLENGRPAILLHVFSPRPPTSIVFPLTISHRAGRYGTLLTAHVRVGRWSRITYFKLVLSRNYRFHGKKRSFLSASCPAPKGLSVGIAPFVLATLSFADDTQSKIAVVSSCKVAH